MHLEIILKNLAINIKKTPAHPPDAPDRAYRRPGSVTAGACIIQIVKISKKQQFTIPSQFQKKKSNIKEALK